MTHSAYISLLSELNNSDSSRFKAMEFSSNLYGVLYMSPNRTDMLALCLNLLQWRLNGHDGVSNHKPRHCLLNCLFSHTSKKTSKLRVTGLCVGNSPVTGEFPAQRASNAENVSIWWRQHRLNWSLQTMATLHYNCEHMGLINMICSKQTPYMGI